MAILHQNDNHHKIYPFERKQKSPKLHNSPSATIGHFKTRHNFQMLIKYSFFGLLGTLNITKLCIQDELDENNKILYPCVLLQQVRLV